MAHDCLKHTTRVPPAVYGQAVTHTAPSRAGMVQPLLWQPLEPQSRPTAVESMSSRAGDMHECDVRMLFASTGTRHFNAIPQLFAWHTPHLSLSVPGNHRSVSKAMPGPSRSEQRLHRLVDSATAVEKEVARADDGSACPGCRTHGQARRHAALAVAKRGRVALGPGRSPSARVGDMRETK